MCLFIRNVIMLITLWAAMCSFHLLSQTQTLGRCCNTDAQEERKRNPHAYADARDAEVKGDGDMWTNLEAMNSWAEILPASFIQREEDGVMMRRSCAASYKLAINSASWPAVFHLHSPSWCSSLHSLLMLFMNDKTPSCRHATVSR